MKQLKVPENISHDSDKDSLTFAYTESDKQAIESIVLIIIVEKESNIKARGEGYALKTMAEAIKDSVEKKVRNRQISDFSITEIDNSEARYFDVNCSACNIRIDKYWFFIKGDYFIAVNLVKPALSEDAVFSELEKAITSLKFKKQ